LRNRQFADTEVMRLTLRFDADLIARVRKYAAAQGATLNQLIRDRL
jgi:predicted HicB family RNase H-like nuclease